MTKKDFLIAIMSIVVSTGAFAAKLVDSMSVEGAVVKIYEFVAPQCNNRPIRYIIVNGKMEDERLPKVVDYALKEAKGYTCREGEGNVVYLNSPGGLVTVGMKVGFKLNDYNSFAVIWKGDDCASACAFAFMGAKIRKVNVGGNVMLHRPYKTDDLGNKDCKMGVRAENILRDYFIYTIGDRQGVALFNQMMSSCYGEYNYDYEYAYETGLSNRPGN